ncbi:unnamed protein product [Boreogadus saida]
MKASLGYESRQCGAGSGTLRERGAGDEPLASGGSPPLRERGAGDEPLASGGSPPLRERGAGDEPLASGGSPPLRERGAGDEPLASGGSPPLRERGAGDEPLALFEFRGRASPPVPRAPPAKRARLAPPLVRRVKSLPVKLLSRNTSALPPSNNKHRSLRGLELQAIKSELTQIKTNIEALLCRLELISDDTHITPTELRKEQEEEEEEEEEECKSEEVSVDEEDWCSEGQEEEERRSSHAGEEQSHDRLEHNTENRGLSSEVKSILL